MKDLTGIRFGKQVAIKPNGKNPYGNILWLCKCDCGNEHVVPSGKLVQGKSRSCGCFRRENSKKLLQKHGITSGGKPRTFTIWADMKSRCLNSKSISYKNYGSRGIRVCDEWLSYENFHNWAITNGYSDELQLDRIDNDGNYEPSNCRWVTREINMRNTRKNHYICVYGETKTISEWINLLGLSKSVAYKHLKESEESFIKYATDKGQLYFVNKFLNKEAV